MSETPKEFQIGNKAKDLLIYTFTVTKPASEKSLETKDVLSTMLKLKSMKPEEVQAFCADAADRLKRSSGKQGFPKSTIHTYIRLLRETAVNIVVSIQMANDCRFEVEYDKRLSFIDEALKGCNLMLQLININVRHLDWLQVADLNGISILLFFLDELIIQLHDTPNAAAEQPVELLRILIFDRHLLQAQIGELREIAVLLDVQLHGDHVDDRVAAALAQLGEDLLALIRSHEVVRQDSLHLLHAGFDDGVIVGGAVLAQQED